MLPLFYKDVAAIEKSRDSARKLAYGPKRFGFCAGSHLAPCLAVEFSAGAREYPIVFVMEQGKPTPVFLFGLRPGQNVMVSSQGEWLGRYLPRYLARYPFIIAELPEDRMILAIELAKNPGKREAHQALAREMTRLSFNQIAARFQRTDHSTVCHAHRKIANNWHVYGRDVEAIRERLAA